MTLVRAETGFATCYACGKCTSGCPVADRMDLKPHQAMRLLTLGQGDVLLDASAPWQCVGCQTCLARCPNGVDIPAAFAAVRAEAMRRGTLAKAGNVPAFDEVFLDMIRRRGRINEAMLAARYRMRTGGMLADWRLGLKMFTSGKMKPFTSSVADQMSVARLFEDEAKAGEVK